MADPVILLGMSRDGSGIRAIGLFETKEMAQEAVQRGHVPINCFYSVITPAMNTVSESIKPPRFPTDAQPK